MIGGSLQIKSKTVLDADANLDVNEAKIRSLKLRNYAREVTVGEDTETIQEALDQFKGGHIGCLTVNVPCGEYVETLDLTKTMSTFNFQTRDRTTQELTPAQDLNRGLQIIGDKRKNIGFWYTNGYEFMNGSGRQLEYSVTTNAPNVGPFRALLATSFGAIGGIPSTELELVSGSGANPKLANAPISNSFGGNVALVERGQIGFATKASNVEGAGASAMILYNSIPGNEPVAMGGSDFTVSIPCYSVGRDDGLALEAAITSGFEVTVTPNPGPENGGAYNLPLGTNYGTVGLSQPGGANKLKVEIVSVPSFDDDNILAPPVLEQPNFVAAGIKVGDKILVHQPDIFSVGRLFYGPAEVRTITAITGPDKNILCLDDDLNQDVTDKGTTVVFLPCVKITMADPQSCCLRIAECGVTVRGIWFSSNGEFGFGQSPDCIQVNDGNLVMHNCCVTDEYGVSANGFGIRLFNSLLGGYDGYTGDNEGQRRLFILWTAGMDVGNGSSTAGYANCFMCGMDQGGLNIDPGSRASFTNLGIMGNTSLYQTLIAVLLQVGSGATCTIGRMLHLAHGYNGALQVGNGGILACAEPSIRIECIYRGSANTLDADVCCLIAQCGCWTIGEGTYLDNSTEPPGLVDDTTRFVSITTIPYVDYGFGTSFEFFGVGSASAAVLLGPKSTFATEGKLSFTNVFDRNIVKVGEACLSAPLDGASPNGVYKHTANGALPSAYPRQNIMSAGVATLTMDPSANIYGNVSSFREFPGKEFCLYDCSGAGHVLNLDNGAFYGCGFSGETSAIFSGSKGDSLDFFVQDTGNVIVKNACGVTPNV